ncbi:VOC family protein [Cryptosporangium sp. NPDC048952]|uniref:VOC family protein n=1 Tax=Cryptosporangium sp. NPDC048952 TaxID=3363961 RepID=UPI00372241EC
MTSLALHLVVTDADYAARWYVDALGATEVSRLTLPDGTLLTVELDLDGTTLAVAGEMPARSMRAPIHDGGTSAAFHVVVPDADRAFTRAVDAGATVYEPLWDAFWGDRTGQVLDPFGHRWAFDQHVRDVPADEVSRLAAEMFA